MGTVEVKFPYFLFIPYPVDCILMTGSNKKGLTISR